MFSTSGVAVPIIVIVYLPGATPAPTVVVATLVPVVGFVPNAMETPTGAPEYVSVTVAGAALRLVTVMVVVPVVLRAMLTIGGVDCIENPVPFPK